MWHQSGKIRFLLLNPNSEVAHKMNVSLKQDNINEKKITKK